MEDTKEEECSKAENPFEKVLNSTVLKKNLVSIGLFIAIYELFEDFVIKEIEDFYFLGLDIPQNQSIKKKFEKDYKKEVLSKAKSKVEASLLWYKECGVIDDIDFETFVKIRHLRNEVTHEMFSYLFDADKNFDFSYSKILISLYSKIGKWWLLNFSIGGSLENSPDTINEEDIFYPIEMLLKIMSDIVLGKEPKEGYYLKIFSELYAQKEKA